MVLMLQHFGYELNHQYSVPLQLQDIFLDAVCGFSHKTTHYALLLGECGTGTTGGRISFSRPLLFSEMEQGSSWPLEWLLEKCSQLC